MDNPLHAIGCQCIRETRAHNMSDDVVSTMHQSLGKGGIRAGPRVPAGGGAVPPPGLQAVA